jgi:hypothetical protein
MKHRGLNELLCAAMINENFRLHLLREPRRAALSGYDGHAFELTEAELDLVDCICVNNLEEFCTRIVEWLNPRAVKYQILLEKSSLIPVTIPFETTSFVEAVR